MKIAGKSMEYKSFAASWMAWGMTFWRSMMALLFVAGLSGQAQAAPGNSSAVAANVVPTSTQHTAAISTPLPQPELTSVATAASPASAVQPVTTAAPVPQGLAMDLSVWGMYQHADVVVKAVMIGLVLASVVTWSILFSKGMELYRARRRLHQEHMVLGSATNLNDALAQADDFAPESISGMLLREAENERELSAGSSDNSGTKERASFRLERRVAAVSRQMGKGTGFLATIGAISPFVGLFGTVWGIMNSFIGIAHSQTTNLAVVAPGIAEALLATALGLVAAIPAVVIYNIFARLIATYRAHVGDVAAQALLLLSRDLDLANSTEEKSSSQPHQLRAG